MLCYVVIVFVLCCYVCVVLFRYAMLCDVMSIICYVMCCVVVFSVLFN